MFAERIRNALCSFAFLREWETPIRYNRLALIMICAGDNRRRWLRHLVFIGGLGDTLSEDQYLVVAAGHAMTVVPRLVQVLLEEFAGEWDLMQLRMLDSGSPCLAPLGRTINSAGGEVQCIQQHVAPAAILPPTRDAYVVTLSKSFRLELERNVRNLNRDHRVEFLTAGCEISPQEAINCVATLCRDRSGKMCMAFNSEKFCEFHSRLSELLVPQEQAYVVVMKVDGEAAAAGYDLIYGPKMFQFQGGWKRSLAKLAIGKILLGKRIEWAINQGLKEYDFLAGPLGYKARWANWQRELLDFEVVNPKSFRGRTFKRIYQAGEYVRHSF